MPFKVFEDGNILTAQEVNDYIMEQQIAVFDDADARDIVLTAPVHGAVVYLKDRERLSFFDGSIWRLI